MTKPAITYGHGIVTDLAATIEALGTWTFNNTNLPGATLTVEHDDWFTITGTLTGAGDEYAYAEIDVANTVNTTVYPWFLLRYKTSVPINGLAAKARIIYTDATSEWILTESFSTLWKTVSGTLTAGKTIDKIQLYADDYPNTLASGTFTVSYDFILICKGVFTFPNTEYGLEFNPPPRYVIIPIPSRVGDITQNLGSESATVTASCNLDLSNATDDWKRPQGILSPKTDYVKGEVFMDIAHNSYKEPFQWLDTGKEQFKVTLETLRFPEHSDNHTVELLFREYSRSSKSNESYVERFGLNL